MKHVLYSIGIFIHTLFVPTDKVEIIKCPNVSDSIVNAVKSEIKNIYHYKVSILVIDCLPDSTTDKSTGLLNGYKALNYEDAAYKHRVIVITTQPLMVWHNRHIQELYGIARYKGEVAIISTAFEYTVAPAASISKLAIHELGHTRGLSHCNNYKCYMSDGNGVDEDFEVETKLCAKCKRVLKLYR